MIKTYARVQKPGRRASWHAVVRLCGKDHCLGCFGAPTAQAQYDPLIPEWLSRGRTLPKLHLTQVRQLENKIDEFQKVQGVLSMQVVSRWVSG